jgi:hypothetical protein
MKIDIDGMFGEPHWYEIVWWRIQDFFSSWVYPAYNLRNFLLNRYDLVRLKGIKRHEYSDVMERMFHANMELISFFFEKENPEEHVVWYKDDEGNDFGHKYGEWKNGAYGGIPVVYPEYEGKYAMDVIKEIHHWWKVDYPALCNEYSYLLSFWCDYLAGTMKSIPTGDKEYRQIVFDKENCPKTLEFFNGRNVKWEILDKYLDGDRNNIFVENFVSDKMHWLEMEIERQKQKYLHLCIDVRPYLWT